MNTVMQVTRDTNYHFPPGAVIGEQKLSPVEWKQKAVLEEIIQRGVESARDAWVALVEIRHKRLYRGEFGTFEEYCKERWNISARHGHRLADAGEIVAELGAGEVTAEAKPKLPMPESESQVRPLKSVEKEKRAEVYREAVELAGGKAPTAKQVTEAVQKRSPKPIAVPAAIWKEVLAANSCVALSQLGGKKDVIPAVRTFEVNERLWTTVRHVVMGEASADCCVLTYEKPGANTKANGKPALGYEGMLVKWGGEIYRLGPETTFVPEAVPAPNWEEEARKRIEARNQAQQRQQQNLDEVAPGAVSGLVHEHVAWTDVGKRLPDADQTVLIFCPEADYPVWLGYYDDSETDDGHFEGKWYTVEAEHCFGVNEVTHWAQLPTGPGPVTKSAKKKGTKAAKKQRLQELAKARWKKVAAKGGRR